MLFLQGDEGVARLLAVAGSIEKVRVLGAHVAVLQELKKLPRSDSAHAGVAAYDSEFMGILRNLDFLDDATFRDRLPLEQLEAVVEPLAALQDIHPPALRLSYVVANGAPAADGAPAAAAALLPGSDGAAGLRVCAADAAGQGTAGAGHGSEHAGSTAAAHGAGPSGGQQMQ